MKEPLALTVNGHRHTIFCEPETPLIYLLRNHLKLFGTRVGCGMGQCGVCTVLIDEVPIKACLTPIEEANDRQITTVEGLAPEGTLHDLQQSFVTEQAAQCGYCLSGLLISSVALLSKNPTPTRAAIEEQLVGNLCRCGTHARIVRAIERVVSTSDKGS
ncbi:MAG: (2Fe-2S)-binding protein [Trueperaceae bacterium]|nr:(2Fe-2S)-binding protein [Trueperaceae bacterium]